MIVHFSLKYSKYTSNSLIVYLWRNRSLFLLSQKFSFLRPKLQATSPDSQDPTESLSCVLPSRQSAFVIASFCDYLLFHWTVCPMREEVCISLYPMSVAQDRVLGRSVCYIGQSVCCMKQMLNECQYLEIFFVIYILVIYLVWYLTSFLRL